MEATREHYEPPDEGEVDLKQRRKCTLGRVCFWLLWVLLLIVLILGALALILYFVYQPQVPTFQIEHFQVQSLAVQTATSTDAGFFLNGVAIYTLVGYNPNKGAIYYNYMNITVNFNSQPFGTSMIPPFEQPPQSTTQLNSSLIIDKYPLTLAIGPAFLTMYNTGIVPFQVVALARAHLNILGISSPVVSVEMQCNVTVNLTSSTAISKYCNSYSVQLPV